MASIEKRKNSDGSFSYRLSIRKKNFEIYQTFYTEEDAKLYEFYKERLIDNMEAFEVPLKDRVTVEQIFELKIKEISEYSPRNISDVNLSLDRIKQFFTNKKFINEFSFDDWLNFAKNLYGSDVFRGGKTEKGKRKMSIATLRRIFAVISSVYSNAIAMGIELENHPLKVIQTFITPLMKKEKENK